MELGNIFNRSFVNDPISTNAEATQTYLMSGNTAAGFGYINATSKNLSAVSPVSSRRVMAHWLAVSLSENSHTHWGYTVVFRPRQCHHQVRNGHVPRYRAEAAQSHPGVGTTEP